MAKGPLHGRKGGGKVTTSASDYNNSVCVTVLHHNHHHSSSTSSQRFCLPFTFADKTELTDERNWHILCARKQGVTSYTAHFALKRSSDSLYSRN